MILRSIRSNLGQVGERVERLKCWATKAKVFGGVLGCLMFAGFVTFSGAHAAQQNANGIEGTETKTQTEAAVTVMRQNQYLSTALNDIMNAYGFDVHFKVGLDCVLIRDIPLDDSNGASAERVLNQVADEFHLNVQIYSNQKVVLRHRPDFQLATCGEHHRVNHVQTDQV